MALEGIVVRDVGKEWERVYERSSCFFKKKSMEHFFLHFAYNFLKLSPKRFQFFEAQLFYMVL